MDKPVEKYPCLHCGRLVAGRNVLCESCNNRRLEIANNLCVHGLADGFCPACEREQRARIQFQKEATNER